jgi:hypothetical protein
MPLAPIRKSFNIFLTKNVLLKRKSKTTMYAAQKLRRYATVEQTLTTSPVAVVKVILVARPLFTPVAQKLCRDEHGIFKNTSSVWISQEKVYSNN